MTSRSERRARFGSEAEERAFWESHDSSTHIDWTRATRIRFPNLWLAEKLDATQPRD